MIVNIRGTSGSGKSTLVRQLMSRYPSIEPKFVAGRKRPIGYCCAGSGARPLWVVGHYEMPCGGGDTIASVDEVYAQVERAAHDGCDVVYEGLIIQSDINRCAALSRQHELEVIMLDVPLEVCLASVAARRAARGDTRELNPRNTIAKAKTIARQVQRLRAAGVRVTVAMDRLQAQRYCADLLKLRAPDNPTLFDAVPDVNHETRGRLF